MPEVRCPRQPRRGGPAFNLNRAAVLEGLEGLAKVVGDCIGTLNHRQIATNELREVEPMAAPIPSAPAKDNVR